MLTVDYEVLGLRPGMTVLDLGAGFGRHAFETARRGASVVAADLALAEMVQTRDTFAAMHQAGELPRGGLTATVVQANGLTLPFADGSFDRIIASEVLEHVPDDLAVMAEQARNLTYHAAWLKDQGRPFKPQAVQILCSVSIPAVAIGTRAPSR